jgi:hypothetical protein
MMKMIQTPNCYGMPDYEIFYDGQLRVVNQIVEIPEKKLHWADQLLMRGYEPLVEIEESPAEIEEARSPARNRKVTHGKTSE